MITSKAITTISYNTENYLTGVLRRLEKNKIIQFRYYIKHNAEIEELKDHIHVYIEPNKRLDSEELRDEFKEKDLSCPSDKPLGVMPFQVCNSFSDFYYYSIHDKHYLASIGENREFNYSLENIICSDIDYLKEKINRMPVPKTMQTIGLYFRARRGEDLTALFIEYRIPMKDRSMYRRSLKEAINEGMSFND